MICWRWWAFCVSCFDAGWVIVFVKDIFRIFLVVLRGVCLGRSEIKEEILFFFWTLLH